MSPVQIFLYIIIGIILILLNFRADAHAFSIFVISILGFMIDIAYITYRIVYKQCFSIMSIVRLYFWLIIISIYILFLLQKYHDLEGMHFDRDLDLNDLTYFTIVTISTTGYGDIVPKTPIAKKIVSMIIMIAMILNIIFINQITSNVTFRCLKKLYDS